jgi:CubicO group peptidase (beta-lactamase class C family)
MVARDGKLLHSSAVGFRDRERSLPMTMDTRFRVASMTKPITSVAVMMLYEQGRFHLDDPIAKYLPEFASPRIFTGVDSEGHLTSKPAKQAITIRHLLTHSAGLGYVFDPGTPLGLAYARLPMATPGTLAEKVALIASMPLYFEPGTDWRYSYSHDVLGRLVEVISGMPFETFLQVKIFDPLKMASTGFYLTDADLPLVAKVYKHGPNGALIDSDLPGVAASTSHDRWPSGGGGLISTAGDYLRFAQMMANGGTLEGKRYLSPATIKLMTSNQVPADAMAKYWGADSVGLGYGLGVSVIIDAAHSPQADFDGDFYWGGYLDTHWLASPATGLVAVLLTQVDPRGNTAPQRTDVDFHNLVFSALETLDVTDHATHGRR